MDSRQGDSLQQEPPSQDQLRLRPIKQAKQADENKTMEGDLKNEPVLKKEELQKEPEGKKLAVGESKIEGDLIVKKIDQKNGVSPMKEHIPENLSMVDESREDNSTLFWVFSGSIFLAFNCWLFAKIVSMFSTVFEVNQILGYLYAGSSLSALGVLLFFCYSSTAEIFQLKTRFRLKDNIQKAISSKDRYCTDSELNKALRKYANNATTVFREQGFSERIDWNQETKMLIEKLDEELFQADIAAKKIVSRYALKNSFLSTVVTIQPFLAISAWITNMQMLKEICRVYGIRPTIPGLGQIGLKVIFNVGMVEATHQVFGELEKKIDGIGAKITTNLLGRALQGIISAKMTLLIGTAAIKECRIIPNEIDIGFWKTVCDLLLESFSSSEDIREKDQE